MVKEQQKEKVDKHQDQPCPFRTLHIKMIICEHKTFKSFASRIIRKIKYIQAFMSRNSEGSDIHK